HPRTVSRFLRIVGQAHSEWHRHLCIIFPVPSLVGLKHNHQVTRILALTQINVFDARTLRTLRTTLARLARITFRATRTRRAGLALRTRAAVHAIYAVLAARALGTTLTLGTALTALALGTGRTLLPRRPWRQNARRTTH